MSEEAGPEESVEALALDELAEELMAKARSGPGRAGRTIVGSSEPTLRQTLVAMTAGAEMAEHESPGEASLHVLRGRLRLWTHDAARQLSAGQLAEIPQQRHGVTALEDTALLLSVAIRRPEEAAG